MKDCPRLFVDPATRPPMQDGAVVELAPGHAHYLGTVLRMGTGDEVALFNARDGEWRAGIEALRRDRGQVRVRRRTRPAEPVAGPVLLFAPLKRDATDLVIRMGTELGVRRFLPVLTERTNTHRVNGARLAGIAVEAAEQCERLDVPEVEEPLLLADRLGAWPQDRRLFVAAERPAQRDGTAEVGAASVEGVRDGDGLLVGPEGGFSAAEVALLRSRPFVTMISLGPRILRADTAVACGLSLMGAGFRRASGAGSR
ncbi:16S ribosomal RNA methyltransferase RsmE [Gluconacetobacter johannae DSM 13595]|uniref:Ribosomal RNA small subunit methyltransferase E n=1 Tax=Gluconacetobacter johannae TaxID=112140 RepID=A0A7W4P5S8_9PROT|nr:16S rRNA (uracil(1498)-N(3))-methyltransferase [Gluconacetobacter johannae]MBB2176488.1 16S rRNA (uracil(1498)-N(3))-methyltransferase [Gluconacetobacter johannae]GBQ90006.1 16S ribosomal RNA methyltransferase RsmE [Gluconacetobacter johannae DSM 13595]